MKVTDPSRIKEDMQVKFYCGLHNCYHQGRVIRGPSCLRVEHGDNSVDRCIVVNAEDGFCAEFGDKDHEIIEEGLRAMKVGDIVIDGDGDERKVLEILTNTFAYSYIDLQDKFYSWTAFGEAEREGWKLKDQEPVDDTLEISMDEVAEKFGKDVSKIRIKKED